LLAALDRAAAGGQRFALLLVNLEKFRDINIELGHHCGDLLLEGVAGRIQRVLRSADTLFHIGADEFAVVLADLGSPQLAQMAARKIVEVVGERFNLEGSTVVPVARVGGAVFPDHASSVAELMRLADVFQKKARTQREAYTICDELLRVEEQRCTDLKSKLKLALDNSDLMLHYQPQVNLQEGVLSGCEALVRWNESGQGWISPELFIPVAETSELIDTLTYWSVNVALREWFQHCGGSSPAASVSVNLSARLLHSTEVVDLIARAMNIWGAQPGTLVLEVTESAMMADPRAARKTLQELADLGVILSIDDFGTGYSSLAYLKRLPVGELKIDKSFIRHMAEDTQDRKIVQSVIDLAHNLELQVVAEGIENQQTLDMLIGMGCDFGQGYYIARPMPLVELPPWVDSSNWSRPVTTSR